MLYISVPDVEQWDEAKQEFVYVKGQTLQMEHSLVSLAKWESKWCKAFFSRKELTTEEVLDYFRCMTITQNVKPEVYYNLTMANIEEINNYIDAPMTATTFSKDALRGPNRETPTAEIIYNWMIELNIPIEFQKWHLNRLLTLIRVCCIKRQPPKKMSKRQIMERNTALNAYRRNLLNTSG